MGRVSGKRSGLHLNLVPVETGLLRNKMIYIATNLTSLSAEDGWKMRGKLSKNEIEGAVL